MKIQPKKLLNAFKKMPMLTIQTLCSPWPFAILKEKCLNKTLMKQLNIISKQEIMAITMLYTIYAFVMIKFKELNKIIKELLSTLESQPNRTKMKHT